MRVKGGALTGEKFGSETGETSTGRRPGRWYIKTSILSVPTRSKRMQDITFGVGLAAGVPEMFPVLIAGLHSSFSVWIYFNSFLLFGYDRKATEV